MNETLRNCSPFHANEFVLSRTEQQRCTSIREKQTSKKTYFSSKAFYMKLSLISEIPGSVLNNHFQTTREILLLRSFCISLSTSSSLDSLEDSFPHPLIISLWVIEEPLCLNYQLGQSQAEIEKMILEEFGRCLLQIIHTANGTKGEVFFVSHYFRFEKRWTKVMLMVSFC